MRLIDADELIKTLESFMDLLDPGYAMGIGRAIWLVKDAPTIPSPQWIRVEDSPPGDEYDYILTYKPYLAKIGGNGFVIEYPWFVRRNKTYKYWMPLPEPPKERYKCRYADDDGVCSKCSGNGEIIYCVEGPCPYDMPEDKIAK